MNESALPYLPVSVQVAPLTDAVCPFPETSATVLPVPSLNAYAATRPLERAAADPPGQPGSAKKVRVRVRTYGRTRRAGGQEGFLTIWD